jgi:hypothetical protein
MTDPVDHPVDQAEDGSGDRAEGQQADYEDLPTGTLRDHVRALSADELRHLITEERQGDNRAPVIEVLESRLAQLPDGGTPAP